MTLARVRSVAHAMRSGRRVFEKRKAQTTPTGAETIPMIQNSPLDPYTGARTPCQTIAVDVQVREIATMSAVRCRGRLNCGSPKHANTTANHHANPSKNDSAIIQAVGIAVVGAGVGAAVGIGDVVGAGVGTDVVGIGDVVGAGVGTGVGAAVGGIVGASVGWHVPPIEPLLPVNMPSVSTPDRSQHSCWLKDVAPANM